ncbi:uncharacterized protein LOC124916675 [Impatiens glandulifera]|uniref:uncharacterized protein LOC124916675 n=1 Tax=Impatiens glandulifera TaxID=253017 RepID=UPI001FB14834|nr:uncharacterized protein LOC124916675 [Impatiens glandulifera]
MDPSEASKYLAELPSRGLFSSTLMSSNMGGMRVYICDHDTSPPEGQLIKTNQTNILSRTLRLNKRKFGQSKDVKGTTSNEDSRKRLRERVESYYGRTSNKDMKNAQNSSCEGGLKTRVLDKDLHNLTMERLRALLSENGLSPRGRKDELIARLRAENL